MKVPIGMSEAGEFGPQIEFRMRELADEVVDFKRIAMERELGGEIETEREIALLGEFHLAPAEIADIGIGGGERGHVMQVEGEILAVQIERAPCGR